jgi:hypothetical protein
MSPDGRSQPDVDFVEQVMGRFVADFPEAVLIGGWATYLRTRTAKSHDIDVIVDHATLSQLSSKYKLSPSTHVSGKKFELMLDGVEVDVYPVYQSRLGRRLQVPVEALVTHTERIGRARVLSAEAQFVAKMAALLDRPDSLPGEKDRLEMWALTSSDKPLDFSVVSGILKQAGWDAAKRRSLIEETFGLLEETPGLTKTGRTTLRNRRTLAIAWADGRDTKDHEVELEP